MTCSSWGNCGLELPHPRATRNRDAGVAGAGGRPGRWPARAAVRKRAAPPADPCPAIGSARTRPVVASGSRIACAFPTQSLHSAAQTWSGRGLCPGPPRWLGRCRIPLQGPFRPSHLPVTLGPSCCHARAAGSPGERPHLLGAQTPPPRESSSPCPSLSPVLRGAAHWTVPRTGPKLYLLALLHPGGDLRGGGAFVGEAWSLSQGFNSFGDQSPSPVTSTVSICP